MSVPKAYQQMKADFPDMVAAYEALGKACGEAGPLDPKTVSLVKLAISISAGLEGAAHSHTRKALAAGCTPDEVKHVAFLCTPTIGYPSMMRGRGWVLDVLNAQS